MAYTAQARTTSRRIRVRRTWVAGLLVVIAAIAAISDGRSASSSSIPTDSDPRTPGPLIHVDGSQRPRLLGMPGGAIPSGTTVFDNEVPGVAKLDPHLLGALRQAAADAANQGVELHVDSGWRSPAYQEQLLRQAIAKYGSEERAARWVATPKTSAHVSGDAVDIGPTSAAAWLSRHGAAYGLCQVYGNEPWHYELRSEAATNGCPALYADHTQDPRMRR